MAHQKEGGYDFTSLEHISSPHLSRPRNSSKVPFGASHRSTIQPSTSPFTKEMSLSSQLNHTTSSIDQFTRTTSTMQAYPRGRYDSRSSSSCLGDKLDFNFSNPPSQQNTRIHLPPNCTYRINKIKEHKSRIIAPGEAITNSVRSTHAKYDYAPLGSNSRFMDMLSRQHHNTDRKPMKYLSSTLPKHSHKIENIEDQQTNGILDLEYSLKKRKLEKRKEIIDDDVSPSWMRTDRSNDNQTTTQPVPRISLSSPSPEPKRRLLKPQSLLPTWTPTISSYQEKLKSEDRLSESSTPRKLISKPLALKQKGVEETTPRRGKRRRTIVHAIGTAAKPIDIDSGTSSDEKSESDVDEKQGNGTNQLEEDDDQVVVMQLKKKHSKSSQPSNNKIVDIDEIERTAVFQLKDNQIWIGRMLCNVDLYFFESYFWLCSVRGVYADWHYKKHIMVPYNDLLEILIYRWVNKESNPKKIEEISSLHSDKRLKLALCSFVALRFPLQPSQLSKTSLSNEKSSSDEATLTSNAINLQELYDPITNDDERRYIIIRARGDAYDGEDFGVIEDLLRANTDLNVNILRDAEKAQHYVKGVFTPPRQTTMEEIQGPRTRSVTEIARMQSLFPSTKTETNNCETSDASETIDEKEENMDEILLTYPLPPCSYDTVTITRRDLMCLKPSTYLNDNVIDYCLKRFLCHNYGKFPFMQRQVLFLSSHFYTMLRSGKGRTASERVTDGYQNVASWLSKSELFERSLVFLPIHRDMHWSLAVIINPKCAASIDTRRKNPPTTCIAVLDPLGSYHKKNTIVRHLKTFLRLEWEVKRSQDDNIEYIESDVEFIHPIVPQQENAFDCGVYILKYAETILHQYKQWVEKELEANERRSKSIRYIPRIITDDNLSSFISKTSFLQDDISAMRLELEDYIVNDSTEYFKRKRKTNAAK